MKVSKFRFGIFLGLNYAHNKHMFALLTVTHKAYCRVGADERVPIVLGRKWQK
jgi:hypothetical protein